MEWKDWFSLNSVVERIKEKRWVVRGKKIIVQSVQWVEITNILKMIPLVLKAIEPLCRSHSLTFLASSRSFILISLRRGNWFVVSQREIVNAEWGIVIHLLAFCVSIIQEDCNYKVLINANKVGFLPLQLKGQFWSLANQKHQ